MQCLQQLRSCEAVAARWCFKSWHAQSKPWPVGATPAQGAYTTFSNKTCWLSVEQVLHVTYVLPVTAGIRWRQYPKAATQWAHLCLMPDTKCYNEHSGTHRHARPCSLHVQPYYKAWSLYPMRPESGRYAGIGKSSDSLNAVYVTGAYSYACVCTRVEGAMSMPC
jgi:hypothetical protein